MDAIVGRQTEAVVAAADGSKPNYRQLSAPTPYVVFLVVGVGQFDSFFWFSNITTMCYCGFHNAQVKIAYFEPLPCIPCFITITFCFISHQLQQELFTLQCASTYRRPQQIRAFENFTRCNTSVLGMKGCPDSKIRGQEQNMARATSSLLQT